MAVGYTLMTEQRGPKGLVADAVGAENAGFDFAVSSDHFSPWLAEQGHAPYAWSVLGAVAASTTRIGLMTYVTCPIIRYHPAVVAQKAATVSLLSDDRFLLGLGAGESLNEHVVGRGWPPVNVRHEMLAESITIIRDLLDGKDVNFAGDHYRVDSARLYDLPATRLPIGVAVSGAQSIERFAPVSDAMIAVEPNAELVTGFDAATSRTVPKIGQQPICWDPDRDEAVRRAHEQFRWFAGGWKVNAELPGPAGFAAATQFVRPEDVAESIPCGPDTAEFVKALRPWADAGYSHVALVQVGGDTQPEFLDYARAELLPALRREYGDAPENWLAA
ncbi:TIGR03557 family F420-dependent LLM class oxidoreductase [Pseudonocardia spinosispora]|uniref:TIGR03557 family F420-dependent LLM class oxidoreductase n=1 Tax=Pseudonocardia spinosispora TaxID=103441 RepID=UPI0005614426|nr:TIGR03557 family F420-dependent LLM class oxidoreductase [Pseudonocardia spinosispora]